MQLAVRLASIAAGLALAGAVVWIAWGGRERQEDPVPPAAALPREREAETAPAAPAPATEVSDLEDRVALAKPPSLPTAQKKLMATGTPLGIFHGRLVYESTGQGVPWFGVMLRGVELQELFCTTDEDGRFHSRYELPLEKTLVDLTDYRTNGFDVAGATPIVRDEVNGEVTIRAPLGATLAIEGEFPAGLDPATLFATVESLDGTHTLLDRRHLRLCGEHWFARGRAGTGGARRIIPPIYGGEPLSAPPSDPKPGPPWRVRLENELGTWRGTATIDEFKGVVAVAPTWEMCGAVAITIRGNWTSPPQWNAYIELVRDRDGSKESNVSALLSTLIVTPPRFSGLQSGTYTLRVHCEPCSNVEIPVMVPSGEVTNVEAKLECPAVAGSIRGEVTSESGEAPSKEEYVLVSLVGAGWDRRASLEPDRSSPTWKRTFEFRDLPAGEFRIECGAGEFGVNSSHPQAARAGDFVRLKVLDRPEYVDVGFRAFDAETGEELPTVHVDYSRGIEPDSVRGARSGDIVVKGLPESGRLWWSVTSPGHLCAEGRVENPPNWSRQEGSKRWIDVRLRRGWSLRCVALEAESYEHLAGAEILVDGVPVAKTNAEGEHLLILPMRPKSLEMRYLDWRDVTEHRTKLDELESCDLEVFEFAPP